MSSRVAFVCTMVNGVGTVFFYLIGGWLSDRFGRRPVMIAFTLRPTWSAERSSLFVVQMLRPHRKWPLLLVSVVRCESELFLNDSVIEKVCRRRRSRISPH
jgi:MFS family permease